ncbi:MAG TPA: AmmeMemoRadiSam system radical SAM enzyme [bacterium]|nr:AmmeMemoRadiSam system radical SAM enzyme [bacterium]
MEGAEARYYEKLSRNLVQCHLCPWECTVRPAGRGRCEVRENREGTFYSLVYGEVASFYNDPIEKKPFYHFLPGRTAFSIATAGCNVECKFCQNWELAQRRPEDLPSVFMKPKALAEAAVRAGSAAVAYTYNEPTIFAEYMIDTAAASREIGLRNVVISNGFMNPEPLRDLCRVIDAYKVDLKGFSESYYEKFVGGRLAPVLRSLEILKQEGIWTEIVYLVVPTLNDSDKEIREMCRWVLHELGPDVPVHFSRFHPKYKLLNLPPTPISTLEKAWRIGRDVGLPYVYLGNVPGHPGGDTACPACGGKVISRIGYRVTGFQMKENRCARCGDQIPGVWI